jgi:hypothetical protein
MVIFAFMCSICYEIYCLFNVSKLYNTEKLKEQKLEWLLSFLLLGLIYAILTIWMLFQSFWISLIGATIILIGLVQGILKLSNKWKIIVRVTDAILCLGLLITAGVLLFA